jgi:hypothetical protein
VVPLHCTSALRSSSRTILAFTNDPPAYFSLKLYNHMTPALLLLLLLLLLAGQLAVYSSTTHLTATSTCVPPGL